MARVIVESSAALLNLARLAPPAERKRLVTQLRRLITGFMESAMGDDPR
jgi:hypothetical protein